MDLETSHVLPALIRKAHEAKISNAQSLPAWGDGSPKREFLFVEDLARAVRFLLEEVDAQDLASLTPDTFVNVGTGVDLSIGELAEMICDVVGFDGAIEWDTSKPSGTPRKLMDVSHMTRLGWSAETGLREGIEKTYRWYLENAGTELHEVE